MPRRFVAGQQAPKGLVRKMRRKIETRRKTFDSRQAFVDLL